MAVIAYAVIILAFFAGMVVQMIVFVRRRTFVGSMWAGLLGFLTTLSVVGLYFVIGNLIRWFMYQNSN